MIEWHRDTDAVPRLRKHTPGNEIAVINDVEVSQCRALGQAGRATGELDVDRFIRVDVLLGHILQRRLGAHAWQIPERNHPWNLTGAQMYQVLERGECRASQLRPMQLSQLGYDFPQDRNVVTALVRRGEDQSAATHLSQRVPQLGCPVCRVDIDQNQAGACGRELSQYPFGIVGRPDTDPFAGLEAEREQAASDLTHPPVELPITPAD